MIEKVKLADKFSLFGEHWSPRIAGELMPETNERESNADICQQLLTKWEIIC